MFHHILVLCAGNICRSPLAEALFRERLARAGKSIEVRSAGLIAYPGDPADEMARVVGAGHGLDLSAHSAQPIDPALVRWADLVMVMEHSHRRHLLELAPAAAGKVYLLGHWAEAEIPDPYRRGRETFESVYTQIETAVDAWLTRL